MKHKYGLRVIDLKEDRPMLELGIGVSETLPPTQDDVMRWCNDRYKVACWFSIYDINKCFEKGMVFNNYFGEDYENL